MPGPLQIRCFMHVPFEGPGIILHWIRENRHLIEFTRFYDGDALPSVTDVDLLLVMGGSMNLYDYHVYPWLSEEVDWVAGFIRSGKPVLGICLGAQIIAAALGAEVYPGKRKEIGWHNVQFLPSLGEFRIWESLPAARKVLHWHGDTFSIPGGAVRIAESNAFPNQGFIFNERVIALQFHLETTLVSLRELVDNCRADLQPGDSVQTEAEILSEGKSYLANHNLMFRLLDYLSGLIS